ncbi:MAG TPA: EAL domain-containing protein, partial [Pseudoxanthomonas sp.]|nr:EAL domain-containing protein [Pseudoxanthomonas sp.]
MRFTLDDFGSGMSSFASFRQLPLDYLKIDGPLVRNLASDRVDRAMLESISRLAHVRASARLPNAWKTRKPCRSCARSACISLKATASRARTCSAGHSIEVGLAPAL